MAKTLFEHKTDLTAALGVVTKAHAAKLQELRNLENEANTIQGAISFVDVQIAEGLKVDEEATPEK